MLMNKLKTNYIDNSAQGERKSATEETKIIGNYSVLELQDDLNPTIDSNNSRSTKGYYISVLLVRQQVPWPKLHP